MKIKQGVLSQGIGKIALVGLVTICTQTTAVGSSPVGSCLTSDSQMEPVESLQPVTYIAQEPKANTNVQQELLNLVNAERRRAGVPPVVMNLQLSQAAQREAIDIARNQRLSHIGSDGSTLQMRVEETGYRWSAIGENIAMGQQSPEAVMAAWMASHGHRENILSPDYSELGLAYVEAGGRKYWVQVFGSPR